MRKSQNQPQSSNLELVDPATAPKFEFGKPYTFRLRMHVKGPFAGQSLWEGAMLDEKGHTVKVVSDADKLENCIDNFIGELQADGY